MPSPPTQDAPAASSSSTAAEKALSSLRARLRSEDISPLPEPTDGNSDQPNHVYAKLRAIFSGTPHGQADASINSESASLAGTPFSPAPQSPFSNLPFIFPLSAEIFALYGQEIYNLSLKAVQSAHEATSAKISAFHAQAASTSAHTRHLYNNISYPLSATLCQSETFPSASLGRHLRTLSKKLSAAETELDRLDEEWKRCVAEEARILSERVDGEDGGAAKKKMGELVASIDDIVRRRADEIDVLDEEFRDLLWAESNRMMQAMMAD
ncbi:hypothetical protein E4U41_004175 [Claviceps citrina]|nr:hypothetical protein E4U41_004175 [Claviceps citrina]